MLAALFAVSHALGDGVLVAAGKRRKHQLTGVGGALINVHPGHALISVTDLRHVGEVQLGVHTMAVQVHGQGHGIHVAGALAIAEQAALHALGTCQHRQLGAGHAGAAVIVGVGGDDDAVAVREVFIAILDLICVNMGHAHLNGDGQVDDHGAVGRGLHDVQHGVADLHSVIHLGAGEALRAVLKEEVALVLLAELFDQLGTVGGDPLDLLLALVEHLLPLRHGGGIIEVDDGPGGTLDSLKGLADDVVAALGQHLHRDILGDHVLLDQGPQELILGIAGSGEADFDLFKTDLDQHLEELQLFLQAHGHDQRLVAVAQVHATPGRCLFNVVFLDPAVIPGRDRVITRCVLGSVHHVFVLLIFLTHSFYFQQNLSVRALARPAPRSGEPTRGNEKAPASQRTKPLRDESL